MIAKNTPARLAVLFEHWPSSDVRYANLAESRLPSSPEALPKQDGVRTWLRFIAREPFFQFMLLGFLIWMGVEYWSADRSRYTIHIGLAERERIANAYARQYGQPPTAGQFRSLIDAQVRDEIFFREGLALDLDKDDEVVRRRIIEKSELLRTDLTASDAPAASVLEQWFEKNEARYRTPEKVIFSHIYFSGAKENEEATEGRARKTLERLRQLRLIRAPGFGDAFPGPSDVGGLPEPEADRFFGRSELSMQLFKLPIGQWSGPYRSTYGWHLIYVTEYVPSTLSPLTAIKDRVQRDYLAEQRRILDARHFEALRVKYRVVEDGAAP